MADVRALLREQRSERRINHPHASYSASGKLMCNVCNHGVKTAALWDEHIQSANHQRQSLHAKGTPSRATGLVSETPIRSKDTTAQHSKRKYSEVDDDDETKGSQRSDEEETSRTKRSKSEKPSQATERGTPEFSASPMPAPVLAARQTTPPATRRTSTTPAQGIELQMPSRPATPKPSSMGRSVTVLEDRTISNNANNGTDLTDGNNPVHSTGAVEDLEAEWAAFEADVVNAPAPTSVAKTSNGVVAAAAPTNAGESDEQQPKKLSAADAEMQDEKEEASRALEAEFEDMVELESRVKKLKEKREALRQKTSGPPTGDEKENARDQAMSEEPDGEGDEEDDEDDDDWDGFRFRV